MSDRRDDFKLRLAEAREKAQQNPDPPIAILRRMGDGTVYLEVVAPVAAPRLVRHLLKSCDQLMAAGEKQAEERAAGAKR